MEIKELENQSASELHKILAGLRNSLREMRAKVSEKQLKTVRKIRETRKDIAQVLTTINKKRKSLN
ncbi:MAG: 50S ribosomal protein L29 [Patescibacteria group bacterium]